MFWWRENESDGPKTTSSVPQKISNLPRVLYLKKTRLYQGPTDMNNKNTLIPRSWNEGIFEY